MPILTDLDRFRLELGDVNEQTPLFNDDEAQYFIDRRPGSILLAVADACDALAARFASDFDVEWQGSTDARGRYSRSQKSQMYAERARALRARAATDGVGDDGSPNGMPLGCFPAPWCLEW